MLKNVLIGLIVNLNLKLLSRMDFINPQLYPCKKYMLISCKPIVGYPNLTIFGRSYWLEQVLSFQTKKVQLQYW